MSEIICPVCNYPTVPNGIKDIEDNIICPACYRHGSKKLWDSFISTKKKLDVAVDALKLFDSGQYTPQPDSYGLKTDASRLARKALEQITALEQKD